MENILFVMGTFLPNPSANGLCVYEIIKHLKTQGYRVTVLTTNIHNGVEHEVIDDIPVYRIRDKYIFTDAYKYKHIFINKILNAYNNICNMIKLIIDYNISYERSTKLKKYAEVLINTHKIDTVISVIRPAETLYIVPDLKRKYPNICFIAYNLDIMQEKHNRIFVINKLYHYKTIKYYNNCFKSCDLIILMKYAKKSFDTCNYNPFKEKIVYSDIPLFRNIKVNKTTTDMIPGKINMVFAGSLSYTTSNPEWILSIFKALPDTGYVVHFYSKGCENVLNEAKQVLGDRFIQHGFVEPERAYTAIMDCDILLNISNNTTYQIPSKIFEYFSTGKPIINILSNREDPAMDYYNLYDNILNIYTDDNIVDVVAKVHEYITNEKPQIIPYKRLYDIYYENTPQRFGEIIYRISKKQKEMENENSRN